MAKENTTPKTEQEPVPAADVSQLLAEIQALKAKDEETQKTLTMLREVADKGRVYNYESNRAEKKPFRVKLSLWQGGTIVGWRTVRDELVKHPTTGRTVGENQEYEVLVLDKDGKTSKHIVNGYPQFSEARYAERIEAEVVGKKEDYDGKITFTLSLPDGRTLDLDSRFVN